ncbi:response regulator [Nitrincola tapanii]|uniref:histidine kinase n=1 Tax=Nitrincola tapanii TaxID=1708751 RepID=A0A5A9W0F1_9GAMM|nr:response regulator [Nitrincola tapanii]KAA0873578.1 response regulator [Nitrincola tapanii]
MNSLNPHKLPSSLARPIRVCLVEDDPDQAVLVEQVLKQAGYAVISFQGAEAFADYLQHTSELPDAVLMDLVLPEGPLAGLNCLSELTQPLGHSLPLIVMSARDDLAARLAASRAGALAYLSKPLELNLLAEQIGDLLWQEPPMKLLILADESVEYLSALPQENLQIHCLQDAKEIMLALQVLAPDVILIDTAVSDIPCLELVSVLSELPMPRKRPVILVDRQACVTSVQALAAGAQDWLSWPSAASELWPRLQLHARHFYRQQQLHQQMQHLIAERELQSSQASLEQLLWEKGERIKESNCLNRITDYLVDENLSDQAIIQMIVDEMPYGWAYPDYTHVGIFYAGEWFTSNDYQSSEVMLKKSLNLPGFAAADQAWMEVHLESTSSMPRSFLAEELQLLEEISNRIETYFNQRRMTQDLIKAKEEAQKANQAKSNFLSSMSHELRTPLNAVLGFAQLLQCDEGLSPDQLDSVDEILKSGEHLLDLINEILDLARMESSK